MGRRVSNSAALGHLEQPEAANSDALGADAYPYGYVTGSSPINASDPSGLVLQELVDLLFLAWDLYQAGEAIDEGTAEAIASYAVSFTVSAIVDEVCIGIAAATGPAAVVVAIGCGILGEVVASAVLGELG